MSLLEPASEHVEGSAPPHWAVVSNRIARFHSRKLPSTMGGGDFGRVSTVR
jgi:hypothetical protein